MSDVVHMSPAIIGVYTSLPFAVSILVSICGGCISDWLIVNKVLSVTNTRKLFIAIGECWRYLRIPIYTELNTLLYFLFRDTKLHLPMAGSSWPPRMPHATRQWLAFSSAQLSPFRDCIRRPYLSIQMICRRNMRAQLVRWRSQSLGFQVSSFHCSSPSWHRM